MDIATNRCRDLFSGSAGDISQDQFPICTYKMRGAPRGPLKGNKCRALKTSSLGAICTKFQCKRTPGTPPNRSLGPPMKPAPTAPLKSDRTVSPSGLCPFTEYSKPRVVCGSCGIRASLSAASTRILTWTHQLGLSGRVATVGGPASSASEALSLTGKNVPLFLGSCSVKGSLARSKRSQALPPA